MIRRAGSILKEAAIDEDERCLLQTDGSFLYLLCKDGLYKVGSGYGGTVRVRGTVSPKSGDLGKFLEEEHRITGACL